MKAPFVLTDVVDRADVGVVQGRSSPRLALEAGQSLGISGDFIRKELESHETVESGILGLIDNTHAASAQLLNDAVMRDGVADEGPGAVFGILTLLESKGACRDLHCGPVAGELILKPVL
jgi:hypothetical protein